ncbi:lamin tail domain-containing protein [bacterium]|nr:lamin tail domain-containing protein [bacterium]
MYRILSAVVGLFFFFSLLISEAKASSVVINEIAWMGTKDSYNNEWIELYNNTNFDINLKDWKIVSKDKSLNITLKGLVPHKGFFLLERSDDSTVPEIKADLIYKGSLSNKGNHLILYNNKGEIEDEINCVSGWFAGNNTTKQTMERKNPFQEGNNPNNWQCSKIPQGTPKRKNTSKQETSQYPNRNRSQISNYPCNIFINEIMPSPEGPDSKNEWIEIANKNNFDVNIENWKITDTKGKTTIYTFPDNTIIKSRSFLVIYRPETKITLNNKEDSIILYSPDYKKKDEVFYKEAPLGKSFSRFKNEWRWSSIPTPGKENLLQSKKEKKNSLLKKENPLSAKISLNNAIKRSPLGLLDSIFLKEGPNSFFILIIEAFCFALGWGILFISLKRIWF